MQITYTTHSILDEIRGERAEQIAGHGFDASHDDSHDNEELRMAAACYALGQTDVSLSATIGVPFAGKGFAHVSASRQLWPWDRECWKPTKRRHDLIKAAALIVAEIERLDRLAAESEVQ
ncbi:protein of unknown function [Hyphomicrobium sp. 1Nfss2.1]|uniref:hypothetical protein n=1 Tax=Hyphomicrobium sp. 1Nfss2.1 TaxID=3413936 RepID=UPI003C7CA9A8